jgi:hypothetical protein
MPDRAGMMSDEQGVRMCFQRVIPATQRLAAAAAAAIAVALAACGGSSPAKPPASASATSSSGSPMPTAGTAARSAVRTSWQEFFNARTPTPRRVGLLQDGQTFTRVLATQARMPGAGSASAQVSKVVLISPSRATVTYALLVAGQPVLTNQTGVAVYQDGRWKVGAASFCGLLVMEGGNAPSLPAACHSGG